jgi:translation initiation factor IF-2
LGLSGAPQAGDLIKVYDTEREAREIANSREQIHREQSLRTKKHITLDEIGRRLAIGSFKELNIIVKGDVDGSIEALSDSLLNLSTEEIQVNIVHKGVGAITEADRVLMQLNAGGGVGDDIQFFAYITSAQVSVSTGELSTVPIQFTVDGDFLANGVIV